MTKILGYVDELLKVPDSRIVPDADGYYWAQLIIPKPPEHFPQGGAYPRLCSPCPVSVMVSKGVMLVLHPGGDLATKKANRWVFLSKIDPPVAAEIGKLFDGDKNVPSD